jgi:hypothetical protein
MWFRTAFLPSSRGERDADNQRILTLIQRSNGASWSIVPSPNPSTASNKLNKLTSVTGFSSTDLYAAGHFGNGSTGGQHRTMIQHWNGANWTIVPNTPTPARAQQLFGIFGLPATGDIWAVGGFSIPGLSFESGTLQLPRTLVLFSSGA